MYMQGIDFTFYWLTGERTHLYLGCWENKRSKKLANGVLPVFLLSYFFGKPKESAAWWALAWGNDLLIIDRENVPVRDQSLFIAWSGAARMNFFTPPFKWCFTEVILLMTLDKFCDSPRSFRLPPKKIIINNRKKEGKQAESPKQQCREKRLEAHQLLWNLEPVETADIFFPVEWTH